MIKKSLVPIIGGKTQLSKKLATIFSYIQFCKDCKIFASPFGGGFHETMDLNLENYDRVIYNEIGRLLASVFQVTKDEKLTDELVSKLLFEYNFSEAVYNTAFEYSKPENRDKCLELSVVERAYYGFILKHQSFNAMDYAPKFIFSKKPPTDKQKERFFKAARNIHNYCGKYYDLEVRSQDGVEVIEDFRRDKNVLLFIDPPYVVKNRCYMHDTTDELHRKIAELLLDEETKCTWILCGVESELYKQLFGGKCYKYFAGNINKSSANSSGKKGNTQGEYIWTNIRIDLNSLLEAK